MKALASSGDQADIISLETCTVDVHLRQVTRGTEMLRMTPKEAELLQYLSARPNQVVSRTELLVEVWGYAPQVESRAADTAIRTLRKKIERDPTCPVHVLSQYGEGYLFRPLRKGGLSHGAGQSNAMVARQTNLVPQRRFFVALQSAVSALTDRFRNGHRLVTLLGGPGLGKTTLANHYAQTAFVRAGVEQSSELDEAWFCDLTGARTEEDIVEVVSTTVGIGNLETATKDEVNLRIGRGLAHRGRVLLVLDNFEHVTSFSVTTVGVWLDLAPRLQILVTSRERLRLRDEFCWVVPPLSPQDGVELYKARASATGALIREEDVEEIAALVRELDGVPLAIELAAARARLLGPAQLRSRLSERLSALSTDHRDIPQRHRTLALAIDWSWNLLTEVERDVFAQLSVFRGPFQLVDAETVLHRQGDQPGAVSQSLQSLIDKSLVHSIPSEVPGFLLFESLRLYAAQRLHEQPENALAAERRHQESYLATYALMVDEIVAHGPCLLPEYPGIRANLTAAMERAVAREAWDVALRIAFGLVNLDTWSGVSIDTCLQRLDGFLSKSDVVDPVLYAKLQIRQAALLDRANRREEARRVGERGIELARQVGEVNELANGLRNLAYIYEELGHFDRATALLDEGLTLEGVAPRWTVRLFLRQGCVAGRRGQMQESSDWLDRALTHARRHKLTPLCCSVLNNMGLLRSFQGDMAEAERTMAEAQSLCIEVGDEDLLMHNAVVLAWLRFVQDDAETSRELVSRSLNSHRRNGNLTREVQSLLDRALFSLHLGDMDAVREDIASTKAIGTDSLDGERMTRMAVIQHALGDLSQAIDCYERIQARFLDAGGGLSTGVIALAMGAAALAETGKTQPAHAQLQRAQATQGKVSPVCQQYVALASALCRQHGVPDVSAPALEEVVGGQPDHHKGPVAVGYAMLRVASQTFLARLA